MLEERETLRERLKKRHRKNDNIQYLEAVIQTKVKMILDKTIQFCVIYLCEF